MAIIKCKMCGGDLDLVEGASTAECEFCGALKGFFLKKCTSCGKAKDY
jgi:primosomal protein N'